MNKVTLYLPTETRAALRALAARTGHSQAAIAREAIEAHLRLQERPRPRSIGIASNSSVQSRDTEDWLEANFRPE